MDRMGSALYTISDDELKVICSALEYAFWGSQASVQRLSDGQWSIGQKLVADVTMMSTTEDEVVEDLEDEYEEAFQEVAMNPSTKGTDD